jgi:DNA-binding NarL/FixJ family response regulator
VTVRRRPALVRSHVITGGRAAPVLSTLDHVTLVTVGTEQDHHRLSPEQRAVVRLCAGGWLSVAEIAAHLALPSSVVKVLVADLIVSGHLSSGGAAAVQPDVPHADLLRQVLEGLHALV